VASLITKLDGFMVNVKRSGGQYYDIPLKRRLKKPAIHKKYDRGAFQLRLTRGGAPHNHFSAAA